VPCTSLITCLQLVTNKEISIMVYRLNMYFVCVRVCVCARARACVCTCVHYLLALPVVKII
jgi:hypothetical protein